jgi:tetratricopeptide (TPR) repeat protein
MVMMTLSDDTLLSHCRALASAGAWGELCRTVQSYLDASLTTPAVASPALVVLFAEGLMRTGHPQQARTWLAERDGALRLCGDRMAIRRAANLLGAACLEQGDLDAASAVFEDAIELARADRDDLLLARSTNNLAVIATIRGRLPEALGLYGVVVPAYQRIGNVNGIAESYHNTAITLRKLQRLDQADEHERRSAEFARQVNNDHLVALTRVGRAEIFLLKGDPVLAEATAMRAAAELGAVPDPARQADAIRLCGAARLALGRLPEAKMALDRAVAMAVDHGNRLIEAESRWTRAQVTHALGEIDAPLDDARQAATIFQQLNAPLELNTIATWLSARGHSLS